MSSAENIVKRPILTEKTNQLRESGGASSARSEGESYKQKVVFEVAKKANKIEIRQAIQKLFNVKVRDIQTMVVRSKKKRLGRFMGSLPGYKKAIVTLQEGDTIEFFEGA